MRLTRRSFVAGAGFAAGGFAAPYGFGLGEKHPFRVAVINDEISQDFDHACGIVANEFGLEWIELRGMWNKGLGGLSEAELAEAERILAKYKLRVTDIASPLYKVDWPGAPSSQHGSSKDAASVEAAFKKQDEVLERSIALAKRFKTDKVRCFDFWRIEDVTPYRDAINDKLRDAAERCGKEGVLLVLENEFACNTATGREAAKTLAGVPSPHFVMNWDPGNAVMRGEMDAFPGGWNALPKERIRHCHVKNAVKGSDGKIAWSPVGTGIIDWTAQFRALARTGYRDAVSLETHWHGAATAEESTRESWAGMKQALIDSGNM